MKPKDIPAMMESMKRNKSIIKIKADSYELIYPLSWGMKNKDGYLTFFTKCKILTDQHHKIEGRKIFRHLMWIDDDLPISNPVIAEYEMDNLWPHSTTEFTSVRIDLKHFIGFEIL